jgi:gamma-glutamylcyclotransferase (GGCT)/AIG2-like uncharacterized protein YtfP
VTDACFTYGSLMCEDIMSWVAGTTMQGEPATLHGHARHPVRDEDYPGMVPAACGRVEGKLYLGVTEAVLARLDRFEGEMYERRQVKVLARQGVTPAWTYIFRLAYMDLLMAGDWSFESFLVGGKARFEQRYMGFKSLGD